MSYTVSQFPRKVKLNRINVFLIDERTERKHLYTRMPYFNFRGKLFVEMVGEMGLGAIDVTTSL